MADEQLNWIWQQPDWPHFHWNEEKVIPLLRRVRLTQGILLGKTGSVGHESTQQTTLNNLLQNIIASSAIEGETLNVESVRSSLAKRLNINLNATSRSNNRSEGLAQILFDAISNLKTPLTMARLFQWHTWLFPDHTKSIYAIQVGVLRGDDPMQVVSGRIDKPTVHFEAPPRQTLDAALMLFIDWFNNSRNNVLLDPLLRAAITHFWFVTLHPFDDGNGRITRALTDLALAQEDQQCIRLYALSASMLLKRKDYYQILKKCQRQTTDITIWIIWFLETLEASLTVAISKIDTTLTKARFWQQHQEVTLSKEQAKILNLLLNQEDENLANEISAAQYQKIAKVSKATATRHLTDLLAKGYLFKLPGEGKNTRYQVKVT